MVIEHLYLVKDRLQIKYYQNKYISLVFRFEHPLHDYSPIHNTYQPFHSKLTSRLSPITIIPYLIHPIFSSVYNSIFTPIKHDVIMFLPSHLTLHPMDKIYAMNRILHDINNVNILYNDIFHI